MIAYLVAPGVEVPFMSTTFYSGPMVSYLGGGDSSWILGLLVSSGLYYFLHRGVDVLAPATSSAPAALEDPARPKAAAGR